MKNILKYDDGAKITLEKKNKCCNIQTKFRIFHRTPPPPNNARSDVCRKKHTRGKVSRLDEVAIKLLRLHEYVVLVQTLN